MIHQQLPDATPVILPAPKQDASKAEAAKPDAAKAEAAAAPAVAAVPNGRLSFLEGSVQVARNATFTLTVQLDGGSDVYSVAPLQIKFDPALVRLNDAAAWRSLTGCDGVRVTKEQDIRQRCGRSR